MLSQAELNAYMEVERIRKVLERIAEALEKNAEAMEKLAAK